MKIITYKCPDKIDRTFLRGDNGVLIVDEVRPSKLVEEIKATLDNGGDWYDVAFCYGAAGRKKWWRKHHIIADYQLWKYHCKQIEATIKALVSTGQELNIVD